ncbi:hypothetical protein PIB30_077757, partial [Stylosanthes scabra]|nr:hypothetical protein [Stylosanthes scabra]
GSQRKAIYIKGKRENAHTTNKDFTEACGPKSTSITNVTILRPQTISRLDDQPGESFSQRIAKKKEPSEVAIEEKVTIVLSSDDETEKKLRIPLLNWLQWIKQLKGKKRKRKILKSSPRKRPNKWNFIIFGDSQTPPRTAQKKIMTSKMIHTSGIGMMMIHISRIMMVISPIGRAQNHLTALLGVVLGHLQKMIRSMIAFPIAQRTVQL